MMTEHLQVRRLSFDEAAGELEFCKMHGAGNDFVMLDGREGFPFKLTELAPRICDRHFGVGADGLIALENSNKADFKMQYFNADGGCTICGNGMRCIARLVCKLGLLEDGKSSFSLETQTGIAQIEVFEGGDRCRVNMGRPMFDGAEVPVAAEGEHIAKSLDVDGEQFCITAVGMGNPHCVIFQNGVDELNLEHIGPKIEHHPFFPERTNVEFVEVSNYNAAKLRVWERGVGETLACGTGICAVLAAAVRNQLTSRAITVQAAGGMFEVQWDEATDELTLTGPAADVFQGRVNVKDLLK